MEESNVQCGLYILVQIESSTFSKSMYNININNSTGMPKRQK